MKKTLGDLDQLGLAIKIFMSTGEKTPKKFSYALARNLQVLKPILEPIEDMKKPSEKERAYEIKRMKLCQECARKDDKGNSVMINNNFDILDQSKFDSELNKLKKEYEETIDEGKKRGEELTELLKKEEEITFYMIDYEEVPDTISSGFLSSILDLIREPKLKD